MARWIVAYLAAGVAFIAGDITWITLTGDAIYRPVLGPLLAARVDVAAGAAFYLIYLAGVLAFGVAPGLKRRAWMRSLAWGALFGLVAYATYDLTNQATLKLWSTRITLFDMGWGAVISGVASAVGCAAGMIVSRR
jgi:uncharacterized membrane protein